MVPIPVGIGITAPIAGRISDRLGARGIVTLGLTLVVVALLAISRADAGTSTWSVLARMAVLGVGMGMTIAPNNNATMSAAPELRRGRGGLYRHRVCGIRQR